MTTKRSFNQAVDEFRSHDPSRAKWRDQIYVVIFEADTWPGQIFDICLLLAILASLAVISLETVQQVRENPLWLTVLQNTESVLTVLFTLEYVLRLISARKPWRYALSFFGVIDLVACLPLYVTMLLDMESRSFAVIRSIRLLRVFRVLKMMRMLREAHDLKEAIVRARDKILVFLMVVLIAVTISGTLMYHLEKETSNGFSSIPQAMYWAIVTMTTVGYGDITPETALGKCVAAILILLGYSLIIVPTGFVSAEVQKRSAEHPQSLRQCSHCFHESHPQEARFCHQCGEKLGAHSQET